MPVCATLDFELWPVVTGLLLAAASGALGWRWGRLRGEARTHALFERAGTQVWEAVVERRGDAYHWEFSPRDSDAAAGSVGVGASPPAAHPWRDTTGPERQAMDERLHRALRTGAGEYTHEFPGGKGEKRRWLWEHVSIRPLAEGRWSLNGVTTDITPVHEAQERLRAQDRIAIQTLARADCLLWRSTVRAEGDAVRWSPFDVPESALSRRLFCGRTGAGGYLWDPLDVPELPEMNARSRRAILSGANGYEQEFHVVRDDSRIWLHEHVSIAPAAAGEFHLVGVIVDITALRRATAALAFEKERVNVETMRAARLHSIGTHVGALAHEFNNILATILGNVSAAKQALPRGGEPAELLGEAERAVVRAKELTQHLRAVASGDSPPRAAGPSAPPVPATAGRAPAVVVPAASLRGRVLLMDDEEPIRKMGSRMLARLGLTVETAANGEEALEMFRAAMAAGQTFDLVMLDLTVPGSMGGLETFRRMRELDAGVRGIVSSGYSSDMALGEYRAHGFMGMIAKPYRVEDCAQVIAGVLATPRAPG